MEKITFENTTLTQTQIKICEMGYTQLKTQLNEIITIIDDNIDNSIITTNILNIICIIIKFVEKIKIDNKKISGENKKRVDLEIGKLYIQNEIIDEHIKQNVLAIYNISAEPMIENMIDISNHINITNHFWKNCFPCL